jgi:hypothetical protein
MRFNIFIKQKYSPRDFLDNPNTPKKAPIAAEYPVVWLRQRL